MVTILVTLLASVASEFIVLVFYRLRLLINCLCLWLLDIFFLFSSCLLITISFRIMLCENFDSWVLGLIHDVTITLSFMCLYLNILGMKLGCFRCIFLPSNYDTLPQIYISSVLGLPIIVHGCLLRHSQASQPFSGTLELWLAIEILYPISLPYDLLVSADPLYRLSCHPCHLFPTWLAISVDFASLHHSSFPLLSTFVG